MTITGYWRGMKLLRMFCRTWRSMLHPSITVIGGMTITGYQRWIKLLRIFCRTWRSMLHTSITVIGAGWLSRDIKDELNYSVVLQNMEINASYLNYSYWGMTITGYQRWIKLLRMFCRTWRSMLHPSITVIGAGWLSRDIKDELNYSVVLQNIEINASSFNYSYWRDDYDGILKRN